MECLEPQCRSDNLVVIRITGKINNSICLTIKYDNGVAFEAFYIQMLGECVRNEAACVFILFNILFILEETGIFHKISSYFCCLPSPQLNIIIIIIIINRCARPKLNKLFIHSIQIKIQNCYKVAIFMATRSSPRHIAICGHSGQNI